MTMTRRQKEVLRNIASADSAYAYGSIETTLDMRYMLRGWEYYVHETVARSLINKGLIVIADKGLSRREVSVK